MSTAHDDDDPQFDNDGVWPRRLLHVPTMTSCKWQPGNKYGRHKEPSYHAISYTWGRWALRDPLLHPQVRALGVRGVPWSIPRIDPAHFSVQGFEQALKEATNIRPPYWRYGGKVSRLRIKFSRSSCEFLWLDVACIDQRGTDTGLAEIGRQARIFRGAKHVYIWLSHTPLQKLAEIEQDLDTLHGLLLLSENPESSERGPMNLQPSSRSNWLDMSLQRLRTLLKDPWFSSLWTLQEAFLCPQSFMLAREGQPIVVQRRKFFQLSHITASAHTIHIAADRYMKLHSSGNSSKSQDCTDLKSKIENAGLAALWQDAPMNALTMARFRKTTEDSDRVYGIMQIFGDQFKVGETTGQARPDQKYTLDELQDELGDLLLRNHPALSQLHVHQVHPPPGKGWRIGMYSTVPPWVTGTTTSYVDSDSSDPRKHDNAWDKIACKLRTTRLDGILWGFFNGRVCDFHSLEKAWQRQFASLSSSDLGWDPNRSELGQLGIELDKVAFLQDFKVPPRQGRYAKQDSHLLAQNLSSYLHHARAIVLLLSHFEVGNEIRVYQTEVSPDTFNGLLLVEQSHRGTKVWNRLGVCQWESYRVKTQPENQDRNIILGQGSDWQDLEGIFG